MEEGRRRRELGFPRVASERDTGDGGYAGELVPDLNLYLEPLSPKTLQENVDQLKDQIKKASQLMSMHLIKFKIVDGHTKFI